MDKEDYDRLVKVCRSYGFSPMIPNPEPLTIIFWLECQLDMKRTYEEIVAGRE